MELIPRVPSASEPCGFIAARLWVVLGATNCSAHPHTHRALTLSIFDSGRIPFICLYMPWSLCTVCPIHLRHFPSCLHQSLDPVLNKASFRRSFFERSQHVPHCRQGVLGYRSVVLSVFCPDSAFHEYIDLTPVTFVTSTSWRSNNWLFRGGVDRRLDKQYGDMQRSLVRIYV